ncbi:hypothetical protein G7Y89_g9399 [Cudoniella acicularis]|uniref:NACHT domain-containing protein n=1 Tax=Cudoniella acicularis TaxID=354080 RepID=A0A8H4RER7_9HELO|nr:hypothetical protein G7Y89_g9399 [Cudoniella acicularis]
MYFYPRLFVVNGRSKSDIISYIIIFLITAWFITFELLFTFGCGTHVDAIWGSLAQTMKYCNGNSTFQAEQPMAISDLILDLVVFVFPFPAIWNLHLVTQRKLAVSSVFLFGNVIEVFLNASSILCFVWGPLKFCLQVANGWAESFDTLLDAYKRLGENLPLLQQYQSLFENSSDMRRVLSLMFNGILDFHLSALRLFKRRTWKHLFRSTWKDFQTRFQYIIDDLQNHKMLVESQANILQIRDSQIEREAARKAFADIKEEERKTKYFRVLNWLSATEVILDQEAAALARKEYPTTGNWILDNNIIKAWTHVRNTVAPLVWINGIPGAGKTILASRIVEERLNIDSTSTIFFYCKYQDQQKKTFLSIARSSLSQFLNKNFVASDDDFILNYLHEQCINSGQKFLTSMETSKELLRTCFGTVVQTYMIIDGLDECDKSERKIILPFFASLVEQDDRPGNTRVLIVSQDEEDIRRHLRSATVLRLNESHNKADIEAYTMRWLEKIMLKFKISTPTEEHIKTAVCNGSDGMFLFAKLVLTNLYDQVSLADLYQELQPDTFPEGFEQAYSRIVHRIYNNPIAGERQITQRLLGWIVSVKRPLKWYEIQGAISIDLDSQSIDFDSRQLCVHIKDLCGSLIDVLPGGQVQLVHETAKK